MIHKLPEYTSAVNDYTVWLGIQPSKHTKNSFLYMDAPLFSNLTKRKLHIGFSSVYMYKYKTDYGQLNRPLFNLYLYKPLLDLYRMRQEELYMHYLHISYDPYYLFIDSATYDQQNATGSILYQMTQNTYGRKNLS